VKKKRQRDWLELTAFVELSPAVAVGTVTVPVSVGDANVLLLRVCPIPTRAFLGEGGLGSLNPRTSLRSKQSLRRSSLCALRALLRVLCG